ncbi:MAG TPA: tetratricopeptide repeat protein [Acidobacteriaceae bacterium]|nr:tetratricopeptide repeat protein [Acidobacteriaceae bacterium]
MRFPRFSAKAAVAAGVLALTVASVSRAEAQSAKAHAEAAPRTAVRQHETANQKELSHRILEAERVRSTGNPGAIAQANRLLIASALRAMARMRLLESVPAQSAELYKTSLEFERTPSAYAELARASLMAGKPDMAIANADKALKAEPDNVGVYLTLGRAYSDTRQYEKAAKALEHSEQLQPSIETLYSLAIAWLSLGNAHGKAEAEVVFRRMRKMAGESGSLHVLIGRAYRDAGMLNEAIAQFKKAIAVDTTTPHAHYFLGLAQLSQNEWRTTPEVQKQMQEEVKYHPDDFLANYMLGFLASSQRQYAVADKYLKKATTLNVTWPEPYLYLGLNAFAQGDNGTAKAMLLKAVKLTGRDEARSNYEIRRAYVDLARIYARERNEKQADVFVGKARDLENQVMQDSQQRTTALMLKEGGNAKDMVGTVPLDERAESAAAPIGANGADVTAHVSAGALEKANLTPKQRATADKEESLLRPILAQSYSDLATAEAIEHNYADAVTHYEAAERWDANISNLEKNLGQAAFRAGDYAEAVHGLSAAVKESPDAQALRAMLGMSYFNLKRYGDAATAFYPLGEAAMRDPVVGYAWAASLAGTGDLKDASQVLKVYQQQTLPNEELLLVAQLWNKIGDYDRAVAMGRQILASDAKYPQAHSVIAQADIGAGKWTDAAKELQAELAIEPEDVDALYDLGFVNLQESKRDEAMRLFGQVLAAHPDYAAAQYEVGKMLMDDGKAQQALPHLEAAAKLDPSKAYVHYQLQAAYRKLSRTADANRELAIYEKMKAASRAQAQQDIQEIQQQKH